MAVVEFFFEQSVGFVVGIVGGLMISWLFHKGQFKSLREEIKNLKEVEINNLKEGLEKHDRRNEFLEQRLNDTRMQFIATQVASGSSSFSGEVIVRKRHPTLSDDFRLAPGSGKIAARLILQQDDMEEAERILNTFEVQSRRTDEAYPYVALATKLAEQDEMADAHDALKRLPGDNREQEWFPTAKEGASLAWQ